MALSKKTKILLYGENLWYFGEGMFGPLFAVFCEKIGGSIMNITWAWATYLAVTGVIAIGVGKLMDAGWNKAYLMLAGYVLNAICTFMFLVVETPMQLMLVEAGLGIASALATPTWFALFSSDNGTEHNGLAWGFVKGSAQLVTAVAVVVGGVIVHSFSFDVLFLTMGFVQLTAAAYQMLILRKE